MRTFDELETLWRARPLPGEGRVCLLVLRLGQGEHRVMPNVQITVERGLDGDRWSGTDDPERHNQVTVMSIHAARALMTGDDGQAPPDEALHLPGDNILVDVDLDDGAFPVGARLRLGAVELEVSAKPHAGCQKFSARFGQDALRWVNTHDHRARRLRGINCRVVQGGDLRVGDRLERISAPAALSHHDAAPDLG